VTAGEVVPVDWCVLVQRDPYRVRAVVTICTTVRPLPAAGEGWRIALEEGTTREEAIALAARLDLGLPERIDWTGAPPCLRCARVCRPVDSLGAGCLCKVCPVCDAPRVLRGRR